MAAADGGGAADTGATGATGATGDGGSAPPAPVRDPLRAHLLVCTDPWEGGCAARGSAALLARLRREVRDRGLRLEVRATGSACLGGCQRGPNMVLYPDGVWYGGVSPDDAAELLDRHVLGGEAVARLLRPDHHPGQAGALPLTRPAPGGGADGFPRTLVDGRGRRVVLPARPTRVAATSEAVAALLRALAPGRIAPLAEVLSGAAALRAGLVLADAAVAPETVAAAARAGVPLVALAPTENVSTVETNVGLAARALGAEVAARAVNDALESQAAACAAAATAAGRRTRAVFYRPDGTTVGDYAYLWTLIRRAGGDHVAPDTRPAGAAGPGQDDAVPLSLDDLAAAAPDVLLLGGPPAAAAALRERLLADPLLAATPAVREGRLHPFDPDTYGHRLHSQLVATPVANLHRLLYPRPPAATSTPEGRRASP